MLWAAEPVGEASHELSSVLKAFGHVRRSISMQSRWQGQCYIHSREVFGGPECCLDQLVSEYSEMVMMQCMTCSLASSLSSPSSMCQSRDSSRGIYYYRVIFLLFNACSAKKPSKSAWPGFEISYTETPYILSMVKYLCDRHQQPQRLPSARVVASLSWNPSRLGPADSASLEAKHWH